jgi:protein-S-isoprenylcysteine O-methyltransferase Ste14
MKLAVMFWSARNAAPSPARSALIKGAVVVCLMLAALGAIELKAGHVNPRILIAVVIEVALTLAFWSVECARPAHSDSQNRKQRRQ